ncbi:protein FAR-RED ELONGATED HYPOCOTYL 3-like [Chenopodium quinoa]|uniref:protein FAR-RED ELONGATED HYPOCOTYL 3-like n=1 Tax=Chenopodium quinoa TaxID=63459 RepID=UPI000B77B2F9|nr:protein FAR-RED ELONGATED HYPOCOTYL 3-like [Chenopodium quinoa]
MKQYSLEDDECSCGLYEERHMWVPAFMKEQFWAWMKTTQRVESINNFFDGFVNRKTKMYEFPDKYTRAMERRVAADDDRCRKYVRRLVSGFHVEKYFQEIYTDTMDGNVIQYLLEDRVWIVSEGKSEEKITHRRKVIRVHDQNLIFDIPSKYVLDRWHKDGTRKHTRVKIAYHDPTDNVAYQRYNKLMEEFKAIRKVASDVDDKKSFDLVVKSLQALQLEVQKIREKFLENQPPVPFLPRTLLPSSKIASNNPVE